MGDEQQRHAALGLLREKKIGNLAAGIRVEVTGRLVGNQQCRRRCERPGDGDTLLLASGKLAGVMAQPFAETDGFQLAARDLERVLYTRELQRDRDILDGRHIGDQMEGLEDDADIAATEIGDLILAEPVKRRVLDMDFTAIQSLEAGKNHQERRFSGTGRSDNTDRFAFADRQIDPFQHMDGSGGAAERQIRPLQFDDGFSQMKPPYIFL